MLFRLAESTLDNTQEMASYPWMSCGTWWEDRERPFPVVCSTMPPVYVEPSSTGNVSRVVYSLWLTHLVCLPSSSPTVRQTSSGQSWLNSSAPTTLTPELPEPRHQPSLTGSSMEFLKAFYIGVLGPTDYWLRFEWQHRGSPHIHGLAWLPNTPDVEQLRDGDSETLKGDIISHADQLVSTSGNVLIPIADRIITARFRSPPMQCIRLLVHNFLCSLLLPFLCARVRARWDIVHKAEGKTCSSPAGTEAYPSPQSYPKRLNTFS